MRMKIPQLTDLKIHDDRTRLPSHARVDGMVIIRPFIGSKSLEKCETLACRRLIWSPDMSEMDAIDTRLVIKESLCIIGTFHSWGSRLHPAGKRDIKRVMDLAWLTSGAYVRVTAHPDDVSADSPELREEYDFFLIKDEFGFETCLSRKGDSAARDNIFKDSSGNVKSEYF